MRYSTHGILNLWMGNLQAAQAGARTLMDIAAEHDFQIWSAVAACVSGVTMVGKGDIEAGIARIEPAMTVYRDLKSPPVFLPLLLDMQAARMARQGGPQKGCRWPTKRSKLDRRGRPKYLRRRH